MLLCMFVVVFLLAYIHECVMSLQTTVRCVICSNLFENDDDLRKHEREKHGTETKPACNQCSKIFNDSNSLNIHKRYECQPNFNALLHKSKPVSLYHLLRT